MSGAEGVREAFVAVNGVAYHLLLAGRPEGDPRAQGSGAPPALLLLHGFTGSARTWEPFFPRFAAGRRVIAVDLLGHGGSDAPRDPARYDMPHVVADLLALLDALGELRIDVLGYSMGGRVALHLALADPERVRRLALVGASPGIADPNERDGRRQWDAALAELIEREGLAAFVKFWEQLPLFESQARLPEAMRARIRHERLSQRPHGLANTLRGLSPGCHPPLWGELGRLRSPTLLVAGRLDGKYAAISREMSRAIPEARLALVPGCGHAVHLERPRQFERLVCAFLDGRLRLGASAWGLGDLSGRPADRR